VAEPLSGNLLLLQQQESVQAYARHQGFLIPESKDLPARVVNVMSLRLVLLRDRC
jgi:hypothetical protein